MKRAVELSGQCIGGVLLLVVLVFAVAASALTCLAAVLVSAIDFVTGKDSRSAVEPHEVAAPGKYD